MLTINTQWKKPQATETNHCASAMSSVPTAEPSRCLGCGTEAAAGKETGCPHATSSTEYRHAFPTSREDGKGCETDERAPEEAPLAFPVPTHEVSDAIGRLAKGKSNDGDEELLASWLVKLREHREANSAPEHAESSQTSSTSERRPVLGFTGANEKSFHYYSSGCPVNDYGACPKDNPQPLTTSDRFRYDFCQSCGAHIDYLNPTPCPHSSWLGGFGHVPGGSPMPGQLEEIKAKERARFQIDAQKFATAFKHDVDQVTEPRIAELMRRIDVLESRLAAVEGRK
jgi:hypothetical protein